MKFGSMSDCTKDRTIKTKVPRDDRFATAFTSPPRTESPLLGPVRHRKSLEVGFTSPLLGKLLRG
jgi:hypothetical protein